MPPTKRKVDDAIHVPRKSSRPSITPDRYGQSSRADLQEKLQYNQQSSMTIPSLSVDSIEAIFEEYDRLVSFMPLQRSGSDKEVLRRHKEIEKATAAIFDIHQRAQEKITALCQQINWHTMWQHPGWKDPKWYWNGNIFDLDGEQICATFEEHPIQDTSDFRRYLARVMNGNLPKGDTGSYCEYDEKITAIMTSVGRSHDPRASFNTFQLSNTILEGVTCTKYKGENVLPTIMRRINESESLREGMITRIRTCLRNAGGEYLDCAAARRSIWRSYASALSQDEDVHAYHDCVHGYLLRILEQLQLKAKEEIRRNTYLAVGTKLPTELADLVLNAALLAEEVPLGTSIAEEVEVVYQPAEHWDKEVLRRKKVLEKYSCVFVQYDRSDDPTRYGGMFRATGFARRPK
ncbi:hypothetical protein CLAFUR0_07559 [Fulvia fulva]|nr:hypothetical protein CLAFUR0_07559 [Fulvia fulva]